MCFVWFVQYNAIFNLHRISRLALVMQMQGIYCELSIEVYIDLLFRCEDGIAQSVQWLWYRMDDARFNSWQGQEIFIFQNV